ncbi:flagellar hook-associated protein FlgK [Sulfitobacter delicatus]|uniref:Flagellar hook-associated protein 1 n=1 Tax=Sulfitobacter delicatus TaxID=218672 RepID=A0A1G7I5M8_9RHOB|nr:flagellar hook-associated protein FlgK [Sulfitobacter delicatus]SDF08017.1 flagellar hook-associated protein 1 FlgK [Sulfitobacter delicatus]
MTISGALSNAMTGLRAAGRGAEIVSSNISNALTPGYGRRVLELSAAGVGGAGGVRIDGVNRAVDEGIASDKRLADAEQGHAQTAANFYAKLETLMGTPDDPNSVSARVAQFETALITAASRPEAPERLSQAVTDARSLASSIAQTSDGLQDARSLADRTIAEQVTTLNTALQQVQTLNAQITAAQVQSVDATSLQDHRQQLVDEISALVPVRVVPRDHGQIALYSTGGAILLDGSAGEVGFEPVNMVTPYMSVEAGTLSGLTLNGNPLRTGSEDGALRGGAIGAQFAIRDEMAVTAQVELDALARDLITRFQDPSVDPTLAAGDAGLFTDEGGAFNPADELGLAARISVHATVDPTQGGEAWRIRDGISAIAPGDAGNASLLQSLASALNQGQPPASGSFSGGSYALIELVSTITADIGAARGNADQVLSFAKTRLNELTQRQLADGVDSDDEIQRLMIIEQTYAANARVIEAVDEMMQTIMRL